MAPVLTLLTDFGITDYYVAAVKGTVLRLAPGTPLVDISHEVEPGDIAAAAFLLAAAAPAFAPGTVHLAVVDPGVGSERRMLAIETADGHLALAPDNGLLTPLLAGARVRSIDRPDLYLPCPGATFQGRDRFAPVAAFLLRGGAIADLGPEIDDPVRLHRAPSQRHDELLSGTVVHIDRFGNLITDIPAAWLPATLAPLDPRAVKKAARAPYMLPLAPPTAPVPAAEPAAPAAEPPAPAMTPTASSPSPGEAWPLRLDARVGSHTAQGLASHYEDIPRYEVAVMIGSLGTLELAMRGENLARRWGVVPGIPVQVRWRRDDR
jgi:S-adenosylmethionine hydrolase